MKKLSKSSKFHYLEPGVYSSLTYIVEAKNTFIQERQNQCGNYNIVEMSRGKRNVEIYPKIEGSGRGFFITDFAQILGSNVCKNCRVMLIER